MRWMGPAIYLYGIAMAALGIEAFANKGSVMSLVGGAGIGVLAIVGAWLANGAPKIGLALVALATVAALGRFLPNFLKSHKPYPDLLVTVLSVVALFIAIYGIATEASRSATT